MFIMKATLNVTVAKIWSVIGRAGITPLAPRIIRHVKDKALI
jgi:hypothetical protein